MKKNRPIIINTADLEHKGSRLHFAVFLSAHGIFRPAVLGNISVASSVNGNLCKNIRNTRFIYNGSAKHLIFINYCITNYASTVVFNLTTKGLSVERLSDHTE